MLKVKSGRLPGTLQYMHTVITQKLNVGIKDQCGHVLDVHITSITHA